MRKYLLIHAIVISFVFLLPHVARATEAYNFMSAVINSLQSVKIAKDRINLNMSCEVAVDGEEVIIMKNIIVYNNELKEAARFIKPYTSSKSELIKSSATAFCEIYSLIILNMENMLSLYEDVLNNIEDLSTKQGTIVMKLSEIFFSFDMLYRKIPEITALSTHVLVDDKRSMEDGKVMFLKITSKEVESLVDQLVSSFGEGIKSEYKEDILPLDFSASLLYSVFGKKSWKPADTK